MPLALTRRYLELPASCWQLASLTRLPARCRGRSPPRPPNGGVAGDRSRRARCRCRRVPPGRRRSGSASGSAWRSASGGSGRRGRRRRRTAAGWRGRGVARSLARVAGGDDDHDRVAEVVLGQRVRVVGRADDVDAGVPSKSQRCHWYSKVDRAGAGPGAGVGGQRAADVRVAVDGRRRRCWPAARAARRWARSWRCRRRRRSSRSRRPRRCGPGRPRSACTCRRRRPRCPRSWCRRRRSAATGRSKSTGAVPVHVPVSAVSVWPSTVVPEIAGGVRVVRRRGVDRGGRRRGRADVVAGVVGRR